MPRKSTSQLPVFQSLDDWLRSRDNRLYGRALAADPRFQQFFQVLRNRRPSGFPLRDSTPVDPTRGAVELGRMAGYDDCLAVISQMLHAQEPSRQLAELEPTYAEPDDTTD